MTFIGYKTDFLYLCGVSQSTYVFAVRIFELRSETFTFDSYRTIRILVKSRKSGTKYNCRIKTFQNSNQQFPNSFFVGKFKRSQNRRYLLSRLVRDYLIPTVSVREDRNVTFTCVDISSHEYTLAILFQVGSIKLLHSYMTRIQAMHPVKTPETRMRQLSHTLPSYSTFIIFEHDHQFVMLTIITSEHRVQWKFDAYN